MRTRTAQVLVVTCLATFMVFLDATIVNVACGLAGVATALVATRLKRTRPATAGAVRPAEQARREIGTSLEAGTST